MKMNFDPKKLLADPWPFMAAWIIGGLLTIFIPLLKWNKAKQEYYDSYGYAIEYEQQQRAYEEQQNGNNDDNYYYNYPNCHWWQWKCRQIQFKIRQNRDGNNNNNNNNGEYQMQYPGWWVFLGGQTEEDMRWAEEQGMQTGEPTGATKFVYAWSIVMFVSILFYGCYILYKQRPVGPLIIMLIMLLQFSIMTMVLVCQGVLLTDERDLEDSIYGWFGQIGVLMVYTDYAYLWFTFISTVTFLARAYWQRHVKNEAAEEANKTDSYYAANDYETPRGTMA